MRRFFQSLILVAAIAAAASCSRYQSVAGDPMEAKICTLDNGLKVYMSVNKDEPRIQAFVAIHAGGKNDPSDNTGLAHYLEHMMFKGTKSFGTSDFEAEAPLLAAVDSLFEVYRTKTDPQERLDIYHVIDSISYEASKIAIPNEYDKLMSMIGARGTNAFTSNDLTCYVEEIPSNQLETWAKIEADRFMNCQFRGFHTELEAVYEEKNMSLADDDEKVYDALDSMLFRNHPYGLQTVIGTQDHLKNPSLKAIRKFKDTWYVPNNAAILLSGDFDPDEAVAIIKKHFGAWKPNPDLPKFEFKAEEPSTEPSVKEVVGVESESVAFAWRTPGSAYPESELSEVAGMVLYNGMAGLVDLDVLQEQKVLGCYVYPYDRTDYGLFIFQGMAKEGQKLEEVRDILLAEVGKLRSGDFPDSLVTAVVNNIKLQHMNQISRNQGRVFLFLESFISGRDWKYDCGKIARLEKLTKKDISDWACKYLGDNNYALVFKRLGIDTSIKKIDAPKITPIVTNRDKQSAFLQEIAAYEPEPIEPVFVDFKKDMSVLEYKGLELLYKQNEKNDIARLSFIFDRGSDNDPLLSIASDYIEYLGTPSKSKADIASELFSIACSFGVRVAATETSVTVSGLGENIGKALGIVSSLLNEAVADEAVLGELKSDIFRARADAKMNQRDCGNALWNYLFYGPEYVRAKTLKNSELSALDSGQVLGALRDLLGCAHKILYYGPAPQDEVLAMLQERHPVADNRKSLEKTWPVERPTPSSEVIIAPYDARQFNYMQYSNRGEAFDPSEAPALELFNEYFGGSMNSIVFQEMRESRALAYSAFADMDTPDHLTGTYSFMAYIASQNDKLRQAVTAFDEIIETLPQSPENLEIAKKGLLSRIRTRRVTGEAVLRAYLKARELGMDEPMDKMTFEKVGEMGMDELLATHERWIKGRKYIYAILGDPKELDKAFLRTLGPVKQVSLEEIFGY